MNANVNVNVNVIVELTGVEKTYASGEAEVRALRGVTLTIEKGEFVAIMGPSGSGKSTLMNLIGCLDRPTRGTVCVGGRDVSRLDHDELADVRSHTLGFVFQNFSLLPRTSATENVELPLLYAGVPRRDRRPRALAALARVGLADRANHVPNELSGGQQQRVAIARAIVGNPALLVADEPTGNLDSRTSLEVMALFQELSAAGITIVLVTHEPDVATHASRIVVVKDGCIVHDLKQVPVPAVPAPIVTETP